MFFESLYDTERPLGHSAKTSKEMNLKRTWSTIKPLRWNIIHQNRSLPLPFIFSPHFCCLLFSQLCCVPFKLHCQRQKTWTSEMCSFISLLGSLSLSPAADTFTHLIGCVLNQEACACVCMTLYHMHQLVPDFIWHDVQQPNLLLNTLAGWWQPLPPPPPPPL